MRRAASILLLLLFSVSLISPLFASTPESSLPLCCRRNGAHHCLMGSMMHSSQNHPSLHDRCPYLPHAAATMQMQRVFFGHSPSRFAAVVAHPAARPQTEARYRISRYRSHQKRGPPVISSL